MLAESDGGARAGGRRKGFGGGGRAPEGGGRQGTRGGGARRGAAAAWGRRGEANSWARARKKKRKRSWTRVQHPARISKQRTQLVESETSS
jgi:hypothetical protein